jgi:hypothetical protein
MLLVFNFLGRRLKSPLHWILFLGLFFPGSFAIVFPHQTQGKALAANVQQTVRVKRDKLKVQLNQCVQTDQKVVCTLLVSSLKKPVPVWVSNPNRRRSRLIDVEGNEYSSFEVVQFGKAESELLFIDRTPIKLVLSFNQLPKNLPKISLLEIGLETYGHEVPVQFRKVNLLSTSTQRIQPQQKRPDINSNKE